MFKNGNETFEENDVSNGDYEAFGWSLARLSVGDKLEFLRILPIAIIKGKVLSFTALGVGRSSSLFLQPLDHTSLQVQ